MQPRGTLLDVMGWKLERDRAEAVEAMMSTSHAHVEDNSRTLVAMANCGRNPQGWWWWWWW